MSAEEREAQLERLAKMDFINLVILSLLQGKHSLNRSQIIDAAREQGFLLTPSSLFVRLGCDPLRACIKTLPGEVFELSREGRLIFETARRVLSRA